MLYEKLQQEAVQHDIDIYEKPMKSKVKGLYGDKIIWINGNLPNTTDKACVVAEELGHYHTSYGDILNQSDVRNRKQERRAREWAYNCLVPLSKIVQAHKAAISSRHELAEYLNVTEEFLQATINRYKEKYGLYTTYERYMIYFEPLAIIESYE